MSEKKTYKIILIAMFVVYFSTAIVNGLLNYKYQKDLDFYKRKSDKLEYYLETERKICTDNLNKINNALTEKLNKQK